MKTQVLIIEEYSANSPLLKDFLQNTEKYEFHFLTHLTDALPLAQKQNIKPEIIFTDYVCHHFDNEQKIMFFDLISTARKILTDLKKIVLLVPQNVSKDCPCVLPMPRKCWEYAFQKPTGSKMIYEIIDAIL